MDRFGYWIWCLVGTYSVTLIIGFRKKYILNLERGCPLKDSLFLFTYNMCNQIFLPSTFFGGSSHHWLDKIKLLKVSVW
jgi:hypothetical protein